MSKDNFPIYLGFPQLVEDDKLFTLERHYLPLGKIGGFPAWLNPVAVPESKELECQSCGSPMAFLLQIYCTSQSDPPHAFHRTVFVFVCRRGSCSKLNDHSNFTIFRCQLPRQNAFYSPTEALSPSIAGCIPDPFFNSDTFAKLCVVCGCRARNRCSKCANRIYCSRDHQIIDWKSVHREQCTSSASANPLGPQTVNSSHVELRKHGFTFKEYGIEMALVEEHPSGEVNEDDSDEDEDGEEEQTGKDKIDELREEDKRRLKKYEEIARKSGITDKDVGGIEECKRDAAFRRFSQAIEQEPEQVLRYQKAGTPLLATDFSPKPESIPDCPICKSPRQFEFQLMPSLLTLIDVDSLVESLDWATLLVYTCPESCAIPNDGYTREWAFKQDFILPKDEKGAEREK